MITNSFSLRTLQVVFLSLCLLILSQQSHQNQSSLKYNFFPAVNGQTSSSHIATLAKCDSDTIAEADSNIRDGLIDVDEYQLLLFELAPSSCNILDAYDDNNVFLDKVWTVLTCVCKQFDDHSFGNNTGKSNNHFDGTNIGAVSCCDAASPHFTIPGYFNEPAYSNEVCQILDLAISAECNRLDRQIILQKKEENRLDRQIILQKKEEKKLLIQQQQQQRNGEKTRGEYSSPELIRLEGENLQNNSEDTSSSKQAKEKSKQITGSPPKSIVFAIAPKFTAFLSICGSLVIILKVLFEPSRRKKPMHRIMLGMSVSDVLASIWYFVGTFAIPAKTLSWFGNETTEGIFWAAGDQQGISCMVAGFFNQFAVATVLYNLALAVYYLLVVKYGWKNRRIAKIEWLFHLVPFGYAFVTSTFAAVADLYGHVEWTCWILPNELFDDTKDPTFIQSKFQWIQWIFFFGVVWMCIIVETIIFAILYHTMKKIEQKMKRYARFSVRNDITANIIEESSCPRPSDLSNIATASKNNFIPEMEENNPMKNDTSNNSGIHVENGSESREVNQDQEGKDFDVDNKDISFGDEYDNGTEYDSAAALKVTSNGYKCKEALEESFELSTNFATPKEKKGKLIKMLYLTPSAIFASSFHSSRRSIRRSIRRSSRRLVDGYESRRIKDSKSKKIAMQGLLYVGAFFVTWLFPTISRITELAMGRNFFWIQFLDTTLVCLQGFLNFLIYIRPALVSYREQNPDIGLLYALKTVVFENKD